MYRSQNVFTPLLEDNEVLRLLLTFSDITDIKATHTKLENSPSILASEVVVICASSHRVHNQDQVWITMNEYLM